jgi:hypothetical protein
MVSCFILYTEKMGKKKKKRNMSDVPVIFYSTNEPNDGRKNRKSSTMPIKVGCDKIINVFYRSC